MARPPTDSNRRRYLRLQDNFKVELEPWTGGPLEYSVDTKQDPMVAFSRDLSVGGICVVADRATAPGGVVEAVIHVAELEHPLKLVGEVIRCDAQDDGRYEIALRFAPGWIDESVRDQLERLVYG